MTSFAKPFTKIEHLEARIRELRVSVTNQREEAVRAERLLTSAETELARLEKHLAEMKKG